MRCREKGVLSPQASQDAVSEVKRPTLATGIRAGRAGDPRREGHVAVPCGRAFR